MKNSSKYNLYNCFCWRFGNHCCLRRNDCPPGVAAVQFRLRFSEFLADIVRFI